MDGFLRSGDIWNHDWKKSCRFIETEEVKKGKEHDVGDGEKRTDVFLHNGDNRNRVWK